MFVLWWPFWFELYGVLTKPHVTGKLACNSRVMTVDVCVITCMLIRVSYNSWSQREKQAQKEQH